MANIGKSGRVTLSTPEIIKIGKALDEHLKKGEKFWEYEKDWSDTRIAETLGGGIGRGHVARVRLQSHGEIAPRVSDQTELLGRLSRFENEILSRTILVEKNLEALEDLHAKLCQTLTVNKVVGVTHLAGRGQHRKS